MQVRVVGGADFKEWDEMIKVADYTTPFHEWRWLKLMGIHGGWNLYPLVASEGGDDIAAIPIFVKKRAGLRLAFSPPPKFAVPYLGPVFKGYDAMKQSRRERAYLDVQEAISKYLDVEINPDYVCVSTPPGLEDIRPWQWRGYDATPMYEYTFDLTKGVDNLWLNLRKSLRAEIKKAQDAGIRVRRGNINDYVGIIRDIKKRYQDTGLQETTSEEYLKDLYNTLPHDSIHVFVVEHDGERVAGTVELKHKESVYSWVGGMKNLRVQSHSNAFLQWECMQWAYNLGVKKYIESGANTRHLCSYKRQFNPSPTLYFTVKRYVNPMAKVAESGYKAIRDTLWKNML